MRVPSGASYGQLQAVDRIIHSNLALIVPLRTTIHFVLSAEVVRGERVLIGVINQHCKPGSRGTS